MDSPVEDSCSSSLSGTFAGISQLSVLSAVANTDVDVLKSWTAQVHNVKYTRHGSLQHATCVCTEAARSRYPLGRSGKVQIQVRFAAELRNCTLHCLIARLRPAAALLLFHRWLQ